MAGSYRHVTDSEGNFIGMDLIDDLGDAHETIEEMHDMIRWLAEQAAPDDPRRAIHAAWREGHLRPRVPSIAADESIAGFDRWWEW